MILAISGGTCIPFFSSAANSRSMRSRSASCLLDWRPSCRPSRRPFSIAFLSTASLAANIILPPVNGFWVGGVSFTGHGCHWTSQEPGADSRAMILAISGGTFIPFFSSAANSRSMRSRSASCPFLSAFLSALSALPPALFHCFFLDGFFGCEYHSCHPLMDFGSAGYRSQDVVAIGRVRNQGRILGR